MTELQNESSQLSALLLELGVQEEAGFKHTRQSEARLRSIIEDVPQSQITAGIQSRVANILDIVVSEVDHSDERSIQSRSSCLGDLRPFAIVEKRVRDFMDKIDSFRYQPEPCLKKLTRLLNEIERSDADPQTKEELRNDLVEYESPIQNAMSTLHIPTPQPNPQTPIPSNPHPVNVQIMREKKAPVFSGKSEDYPQWSSEFNDFLSADFYSTEGAKYQALLEAMADAPEAKNIVRACSSADQAMGELKCQYYKPYHLIYRFFQDMIKTKQIGEDDLQGYLRLLTDIKLYVKYLRDHQRGHILAEGAFVAVLSTIIPHKRRKDFRLDDASLSDAEKGRYFEQHLAERVAELQERVQFSGGGPAKGRVSVNAVASVSSPVTTQPRTINPRMHCNMPGCIAPIRDHWTRQCRAWADLSSKEKGEMVVKQGWCHVCLESHSPAAHCGVTFRYPCARCKKLHAQGICEFETGPIAGLVINAVGNNEGQTLLCAETVGVDGGGEVAVLYDLGANVSIVEKEWVDKMGL